MFQVDLFEVFWNVNFLVKFVVDLVVQGICVVGFVVGYVGNFWRFGLLYLGQQFVSVCVVGYVFELDYFGQDVDFVFEELQMLFVFGEDGFFCVICLEVVQYDCVFGVRIKVDQMMQDVVVCEYVVCGNDDYWFVVVVEFF